MRLLTIAALLLTLPWVAVGAPTWQTILSDPGRKIELDRTSIKHLDGGKVQAEARVILEKELIDAKTGAGYRFIEATTRYDCNLRNASTIKRIFKKNETDIIREEDIKGPELPVRSGTLDDKVLREVCRPPKDNALEVAQKVNEAAGQLKDANAALLKKELAKSEPPAAATNTAERELIPKHAPIPYIRPMLGMAMETDKTSPVSQEILPVKESLPAKPPPAIVSSNTSVTVTTHTARPLSRAHKPVKSEGYMLELAHNEAVQQHALIHWDYEGLGGPDNWATLDPKNQTCATGQRQSPIDIRDGIKVDLEPIKFNYRPSTFRIVDNGHTVQVAVGDSSITQTGKTYELVQFHFHRPSEEKVNGQRFDMVVHLVHKADDGQIAVVAVLLERGNENPFIQTLWNNLPLEKNMDVSPPDAVIDPATLLPAERNYYTYMGSLTTPPCTEGVLWLVMKKPAPVSAEQINIFSRLYKNNARPTQPADGRLIKESR
jgi:carbonic anhydrase